MWDLDLETTLRVAVIRGNTFENFTRKDHRMVAISGVTLDEVQSAIQSLQLNAKQIQVAAINALCIIRSLDRGCRFALESMLIRKGAESSQIHVSGLWHTEHMEQASATLFERFTDLSFSEPLVRFSQVHPGTTGKRVRTEHDLAYGVSTPVQWNRLWKGSSTSECVDCRMWSWSSSHWVIALESD